jgi:hypothetical protein
MSMRNDCRHFESRTFNSGDTVRRCKLDLAPEAPWRCPTECPKFDRRSMDVGWTHGTMVTGSAPAQPTSLDDGSAAAILSEAESIINAIASDVVSDLERGKPKKSKRNKKRKK